MLSFNTKSFSFFLAEIFSLQGQNARFFSFKSLLNVANPNLLRNLEISIWKKPTESVTSIIRVCFLHFLENKNTQLFHKSVFEIKEQLIESRCGAFELLKAGRLICDVVMCVTNLHVRSSLPESHENVPKREGISFSKYEAHTMQMKSHVNIKFCCVFFHWEETWTMLTIESRFLPENLITIYNVFSHDYIISLLAATGWNTLIASSQTEII